MIVVNLNLIILILIQTQNVFQHLILVLNHALVHILKFLNVNQKKHINKNVNQNKDAVQNVIILLVDLNILPVNNLFHFN